MTREHVVLWRAAGLIHGLPRSNESRLLRFALGTVFIWFGALKLMSESSVLGLIQSSYPFLARAPLLQALGLAETVLGGTVLIGWHVRTFATLMALHLGGTLLVPFLAPSAAFDPGFPTLTLQGEFVVKNLVLITSALLLAERN